MNKFLSSLVLFVALITNLIPTIFANGNLQLTIGTTSNTDKEILDFIMLRLFDKGIDLIDIREFSDYVSLNLALEQESIDANFFQNKPYLELFSRQHGIRDLVTLGTGIYVEPMLIMSSKYGSIKRLKVHDTVGIPEDPIERARALIFLHNSGFIKLKDPTKINATTSDIAENRRRLRFKEFDTAEIANATLREYSNISVMSFKSVLENDELNVKNALLKETNVTYAEYIVVKANRANDEAIRILNEVIHSSEVRTFILNNYEHNMVPTF